MGFDVQKKDIHLVPKMNIKDFNINIDSSKLKIDFDWKFCPSVVIDSIIFVFKGTLLNKVKAEAKTVVNTKVIDMINAKLLLNYPIFTPVGESMSLTLAPTAPVKVKSDYIYAPIDGTIFKTSEGYNRPSEPEVIPSENPTNPGEILFFASPHVLNTLSNTLRKLPMKFNKEIKGYNLTIDYNPASYPLNIFTEEDNIHIHGGVNITIPSLDMKIEVGGFANIFLEFLSGDKNNTIYLSMEIFSESIKFDLFRVYIKGVKVSFNWALGLANYIIDMILDFYDIPLIPIAKSPTLPLTATRADLKLFKKYTEVGVSFVFGLEDE